MRIKLGFLAAMMLWLNFTPVSATNFAAYCVGGGDVNARENFDPNADYGWYCSYSPGDAEHMCLYEQDTVCEQACASCAATYAGTSSCTSQRSEGQSPGDPLAIQYCAENKYAQYFDITCNCNLQEPSCTTNGLPCTNPSDCCSNICGDSSRTCGIPTPLLVHFGGPLELSSSAGGVLFDFYGNGNAFKLPWPSSPRIAWIVFDRNNNGLIDDGSELFGNRTVLANGSTAEQGFEALADLDTNHDGRITRQDAAFGQLALWFDFARDGVTARRELIPLRLTGITAISIDYSESTRTDRWGNTFRYKAQVTGRGGERLTAYDVFMTAAE